MGEADVEERCQEFRRSFLYAEDGFQDDHHLAGCASCRAFVETERATARLVKTSASSVQTPLSLRDSVTVALAHERVRHRRLIRLRNAAAVAAGTVLLVAAAAGIWSFRRAAVSGRHHDAADLIARDFLEYAGRGAESLELTGSDSGMMEAFFADKLRLAVQLPALKDAYLVGGRRCSLEGKPAALVLLRARGRDEKDQLALFTFEQQSRDNWAWPDEGGSIGNPRHHAARGVGIVSWQARGLVYALAGTEDADRLAARLGSGR